MSSERYVWPEHLAVELIGYPELAELPDDRAQAIVEVILGRTGLILHRIASMRASAQYDLDHASQTLSDLHHRYMELLMAVAAISTDDPEIDRRQIARDAIERTTDRAYRNMMEIMSATTDETRPQLAGYRGE